MVGVVEEKRSTWRHWNLWAEASRQAMGWRFDASRAALPIPQSLALALSAHVAQWSAEGFVFVNEWGDQLAPWTLQRAIRTAREKVPGLPPDFRFHDLRHYLASMLIASGADVKVVQARLRHASAKTTLDTYAHLWPDSDESTRIAIDAVMQARAEAVQSAEPDSL